jgi:uncharacterized membrane protein YphA (DoxX/SURF4 family)
LDTPNDQISLGVRVYGAGALALGLVGLAWDDFALQWQPVPDGLPARPALAYLFALLLIAAGAAINLRRFAKIGAAACTALYGIIVLFMHGPNIVPNPLDFPLWDGAAEQTALFCGGWAAYSFLVGRAVPRAVVVAMSICLLMFGAAHFLYLGFTASMVPSWLPGGQTFWAAFTGVAHLAAGIALLSGVQVRLATILLTVMFAIFGALVHLPLLIAGPHSHLNWVMNAVNLALTGAAWTLVAPRVAYRPPALEAQARPASIDLMLGAERRSTGD